MYLVYSYLKDKTILEFKGNNLIVEIKRGLPQKVSKQKYNLDNVVKIRLIQTHNLLYGQKKMVLTKSDGAKQVIEINLRYYQMVKLQEYFKDILKIETSLIG